MAHAIVNGSAMARALLCWAGLALLGLVLAPYLACLALWVVVGLGGRAARRLTMLRPSAIG